MNLDSDQDWISHLWRKKGVIQALNQRLFTIMRIANHLPNNKLRIVANSIWMSKVRYCFQVTNKVRLMEDDGETEKQKT